MSVSWRTPRGAASAATLGSFVLPHRSRRFLNPRGFFVSVGSPTATEPNRAVALIYFGSGGTRDRRTSARNRVVATNTEKLDKPTSEWPAPAAVGGILYD